MNQISDWAIVWLTGSLFKSTEEEIPLGKCLYLISCKHEVVSFLSEGPYSGLELDFLIKALQYFYLFIQITISTKLKEFFKKVMFKK